MVASVKMASPFSSKYTLSKQERLLSSSPRKFDQLLDIYTQMIHSRYVWPRMNSTENAIRKINWVFTPAEIQDFLFLTQSFEGRELYPLTTGLVVSKLIQNSYWNGHYKYTFDLRSFKPLHHLCYDLTANRTINHIAAGQDLEVRVLGNGGVKFGMLSTGGTYYVDCVGDNSFTRTHRGVYHIKKAGTLPL